MTPDRKLTAEEKKRRKRARKELESLFRLIEAGCKRLAQFEETMQRVEKLRETLERYQDLLDPGLLQKIDGLIAQIDRLNKSGDQFCELARRVKQLTNTLYSPVLPHWAQNLLPATGGGGVLAAAISALVILGAVITTFSPYVQATIRVTNRGCEAIPAPQGLPNLPGVSLWQQPIRDGETGLAQLPPFLQLQIDARQSGQIAISLYAYPVVTFQPGGLKSLLLNNREIIGQMDAETTGVKARYDLIISCQ